MNEITTNTAEIQQFSSVNQKKLKNNFRQSIIQTKKRIRSQTALQGPRGRYNNYFDAKINWKVLFTQILSQSLPAKTYLRNHYPKIKYTTFATRFNEYKQCGQLFDGTTDDRGGHNAAMTVEEEKIFATYIKTEYLYKKILINATDLRSLAVSFYDENLHPNNTRSSPIFKCSNDWVHRFMKRHGFYNSNGRIVKQPQITDRTNAAAKLYLAQCARAYLQYGADKLFTMDETFWPLVAKQQQLIRIHNNSELKLSSKSNPKDGCTLVVTVAANGNKLPLMVLGKGKSMVCTDKYKVEDNAFIKTFYTESGWMREEAMLQYLYQVIIPAANGEPSALMLDCHSSHITQAVYDLATSHHVEMIIVPACMTSILSPLDVGINAVLKATYSKNWRQMRLYSDVLTTADNWEQAMIQAEKSFNLVSKKCILSSFKKSVHLPPEQEDLIIYRGDEARAKSYLLSLPGKRTQKQIQIEKINQVIPLEQPTRTSTRIKTRYNDDYIIATQLQNNIYDDFDSSDEADEKWN
jgi:hypothetical protein